MRIRAALILMILAAGPARVASQTVYGPGGLFVHPTAFLPAGSLPQANLSWFTQKAGETESRWIPASLTFTPNKRSQVGGLFVSRRIGGVERSSGGLFAKYQIREGGVLTPALAVVGSFLGGDVQQVSLTGVGSWRIPALRGVTGHSGIQWARRADLPVSQDGFARFLGLEVPIGSGLRFIAETGSRFRFDRKEASAYGLMWSTRAGFSLGVGLVNTGRSDRNRPFIGAGYTIAGNR